MYRGEENVVKNKKQVGKALGRVASVLFVADSYTQLKLPTHREV